MKGLIQSILVSIILNLVLVSGNNNDDSRPNMKYELPKPPLNPYLCLFFTSPMDIKEQLMVSEDTKYDGKWAVEIPYSSALDGDFGLVLKSKAKHHALAARLRRPYRFDRPQLVVQYEVKLQKGIDCGGAYLKMLSFDPKMDLKHVSDKTLYTIMFGPDKCGESTKIHFIQRWKNPATGAFQERHAKPVTADIKRSFTDKKTHLYTLVVNADNTFEIYLDQNQVNSGSMLTDMQPPIKPSKELDDPTDKRPEDWDDRLRIPDTSAVKPDDWDESQPMYIADPAAKKPEGWLDFESPTIPDPQIVKPADWDDSKQGQWEAARIDNPKCKTAPGCGEWQAPKVRNPLYKGKWSAPLVDNPNYQGQWKQKRIPNPHYDREMNAFRMVPFSAIGFELWAMTEDIVFDNILVVDNKADADAFAAQTWIIKTVEERRADPSSRTVVDAITENPLWLLPILLFLAIPVGTIVWWWRSPRYENIMMMRDAAMRKKKDEEFEEEQNAKKAANGTAEKTTVSSDHETRQRKQTKGKD